MSNPKADGKVSELSYHGPLIGMRSTRPQPSPADANKKASSSEKRRIADAFPELISSYESIEHDSPAVELDRKLSMIRRGLQQRFPGVEIDFYREAITFDRGAIVFDKRATTSNRE